MKKKLIIYNIRFFNFFGKNIKRLISNLILHFQCSAIKIEYLINF